MSPMLFILVMDVLCFMVMRATDEGLLQSLSSRALHIRISLYVDDVVLLLGPSSSNVGLTMDILRLFGGMPA